jgi:hypothetical protein
MQLLDKVNIIYTEYIPGTAGDFFSQYTAGCSDKIIGFNILLEIRTGFLPVKV